MFQVEVFLTIKKTITNFIFLIYYFNSIFKLLILTLFLSYQLITLEVFLKKKIIPNCLNHLMCPFGFKLLWRLRFCSAVFSFFFFLVQPAFVDFCTVNSAFVHCSRTHKFHFSATFSLKMGPTVLFTHLKNISLQCFQFQQK